MTRKTYEQIIGCAAQNLSFQLRDGKNPVVYSFPSNKTEQGGLIVTSEPMPAPFTVIRNNRGSSWRHVAYSQIYGSLYNACKREPIL